MYPKPAEVALIAKDGETVLSSEEYDHVDPTEHYVRLQPTVRDHSDCDDDQEPVPETLYVPWRRVHMIRRDYSEVGHERS